MEFGLFLFFSIARHMIFWEFRLLPVDPRSFSEQFDMKNPF